METQLIYISSINKDGSSIKYHDLQVAPQPVCKLSTKATKPFFSAVESTIYSGIAPHLLVDSINDNLINALSSAGYDRVEEPNDKTKCFVISGQFVFVYTGARLQKYKRFTIQTVEAWTGFNHEAMLEFALRHRKGLASVGFDIKSSNSHRASLLYYFYKERQFKIGKSFFNQLRADVEKYGIDFGATTDEENNFIRQTNGGGWVFADEESVNHKGASLSYDVNGLYPHIAMTQDLPVGRPVMTVAPRKPLYITEFRVSSYRLKEGHFPSIAAKKVYGYKFPSYDKEGTWAQFCMTSVEFETFVRDYDFEGLVYLKTLNFESCREVLNDYLTDMNNKKEESAQTGNSFLRAYYKNRLNILLGHLSRSNGGYTPLFRFVAAYGRQMMTQAAMNNKDRFLMCLTDSFKLKDGAPFTEPTDESKMGSWKLEANYTATEIFDIRNYGFKGAQWNWVFGNVPSSVLSRSGRNETHYRKGDVILFTHKGEERQYTI